MESEPRPLAVVLKGWPRLSETFIAQELAGLEALGLRFEIWSLRRPTDARVHPVHREVRAPARYLPEYLLDEPLRVLRGVLAASRRPAFNYAMKVWLNDLGRDFSLNRVRRFGQACVLATEMAEETRFFYAHFMHTPGSVARYAAMICGMGWGVSAHARDIWTIPGWEKREKLGHARFAVTCTQSGAEHLKDLAPEPERVRLVHHGLELARLPPPPALRPPRDGQDENDPFVILSVGRLVEKKGYDDLVKALADLPRAMRWRFVHIGGGPLRPQLAALAEGVGVAHRIEWRGARTQDEVIDAMRWADLFVMPSRLARDGDRDGLPNVLLEAASQELPIVATAFSAIPEFIVDGQTGYLTPSEAPRALAETILRVARDPEGRVATAKAARARLRAEFAAEPGLELIAARLKAELAAAG